MYTVLRKESPTGRHVRRYHANAGIEYVFVRGRSILFDKDLDLDVIQFALFCHFFLQLQLQLRSERNENSAPTPSIQPRMQIACYADARNAPMHLAMRRRCDAICLQQVMELKMRLAIVQQQQLRSHNKTSSLYLAVTIISHKAKDERFIAHFVHFHII